MDSAIESTHDVYIAGSLRNPLVPVYANSIANAGLDVFVDWFAAGPEADDKWKEYEKTRGRSYETALKCPAAQNVFHFDKRHIDASRAFVLILPAGKSGHMELGYAIGKGKPGYILLDCGSERWDVMYNFATGVFSDLSDLVYELRRGDNLELFND